MTSDPLRFDLSVLDLSPETRQFLPIRAVESFAQQREFGTWWFAALASTDDSNLLGIRAIPGRKLVDCPVVYADGPATVTVASTSRTLVPVMVFAQMAVAPRYWNEASKFLDSEWEELLVVHRLLGGDDELAALRTAANDDKLREQCVARGNEGRATVANVLDRLDPSAARKRVRELLSGNPGKDSDLTSSDLAWSAAISALGLVDTARLEERLDAAWAMFHAPAALDVCWSGPLTPWPQPVATEAATRLHECARLLVAHPSSKWNTDPLWQAVEQLADARTPFSFSGVPFIEAAQALDEQGHAERAFNAVTAVQFWACLGDGVMMEGALAAANMIATREEWKALQLITESVMSELPSTDE